MTLTTLDIILSLVRTRSIGYLRDVRRLTVALSRARLGLYILGRRSVFESCFELKPAFDVLLSKPDELTLVTGEMYGQVNRLVNGNVVEGEAIMEGVEHLGKYVFEMTKAKVEALKLGGGVLRVMNETNGDVQMEDEDAADREENVLIKVDDVEEGDDDVAEEPVVV